MKLKIKLLLTICLLCSCQTENPPPPIDSENPAASSLTNEAEDLKPIDLFSYLKTDRTEGTRYTPKENTTHREEIPIEEVPEDILAIVNGSFISKEEVYQYLRDKKEDLNIFPVFRDNKVYEACTMLIFNKLVDHALKTGQLTIEPQDIKTEYEKMDRILKSKNITKEKLLENKNMTEEELDRLFKVYAYINSLVTDEMIEKQYEKSKLDLPQKREIVFLSQGGENGTLDKMSSYKKMMDRIRAKASQTKDLAPLSIKYSHHPYAKSTNGLMHISQGDERFHSDVYDLIFELEEGEISKVQQLPEHMGHGYFMVQLKKIHYPPLEVSRLKMFNKLTEKLQMIFNEKLRQTNQVTQRERPEVPEEFRSNPVYK